MNTRVASGDLCEVYLCKNKNGHVTSAVKKYKTRKSGVSYAVLREINLLREIQHSNIIKINEITFDEKICIYLEYGGITLSNYSKQLNDYDSRNAQLKCIAYQLIKGISVMHKYKIIHRDIKPDNIFVTINDYPHLKIGDFGLAKKVKSGTLSPSVCTLNYRPPEVLVESKKIYSLSLDIWSIACTLFEFLFDRDLFVGKGNLGILNDILTKLCINNISIPVSNNKHIKNIKYESKNTNTIKYLDIVFSDTFDKSAMSFKNLIENMLKYDPNQRITAFDALNHKFLKNADKSYIHNDTRLEIVLFVRCNICISEASRNLAIDHIIEIKSKYKYIKKRTILCAIDIFDMFMSSYMDINESDLPILLDDSTKLIKNLNTPKKSKTSKTSKTSINENCEMPKTPKSPKSPKSQELILIAYICVYIASKFYDIDPWSLEHLTINFSKTFSKKKILEYEKLILVRINYRLCNINLLDIYESIIKEKPHKKTDKYWEIIIEIISNYRFIKNKEYDEIKKILSDKL